MPLARAIPRTIAALLAVTLGACAGGPLPVFESPPDPPPVIGEPALAPALDNAQPLLEPAPTVAAGATARMPREIRLGSAEMVIQRVEEDVSRTEIAAAIEPMLANAPICIRFPPLWLERGRLTNFTVRYAMMARDWGEDAARGAEAQMDEFVALGFMTKRSVSTSDPRAIEYTLTADGQRYLSGVIEPGRRPSFCAPAERQLADITAIEWGEYPCGTLQVRFRHVADAWPSWARTEEVRATLAATWPALGEPGSGSVSLGRQWYGRDALPAGFANGSLRSVCYDASRRVVTGTDLNLSAAP
jgi:hypothetical protein